MLIRAPRSPNFNRNGCGGNGDTYHGRTNNQSRKYTEFHNKNMDSNLGSVLPEHRLIYAKKNGGGFKDKKRSPRIPNKVASQCIYR